MNEDDLPEDVVKRTITIEVYEKGGFNVIEDGRYSKFLCWDEMLGTIAELTHPKIAQGRYRMLTREEWEEEERSREAKRQNRLTTKKEPQP